MVSKIRNEAKKLNINLERATISQLKSFIHLLPDSLVRLSKESAKTRGYNPDDVLASSLMTIIMVDNDRMKGR